MNRGPKDRISCSPASAVLQTPAGTGGDAGRAVTGTELSPWRAAFRRPERPVAEVQGVERIWPLLADGVFVPHTESDYQRLVAFLDALIDLVGEEESHPLALLMEVVGVLIEKYEAEHVPHLTGT